MSEASLKPSGQWPIRRLFDLCFFIPGKAHEPFIDPLGDFVCVNAKFVSTDGIVAKNCSKNLAPARKGDILMVMSDLPNGRALAKCFLVDADEKYAVNQRVCILRPKAGNEPRLLFHMLNRNSYFLAFDDGVNQTHLLNPVFEKCELVVAETLHEQQAIAAALSDADGVVAGLERLIAKKRLIKQGAMQDLLTARRRLPGFSGEWEVKRLADLGEISGSGVDKKIQKGERPVCLLNYTDVYRQRYILGSMLNHWVTASEAKGRRCSVRKGDVFFTPTSETPDDIAQSAVVAEDIDTAAYSYHVVRLRLKDQDSADFWAHVFEVESFRSQARENADGSGTRYVITLPKFRNMTISVPARKEREAIGEVLRDMHIEIQTLQARLAKARAIKEGMMQNLLTGRVRLV